MFLRNLNEKCKKIFLELCVNIAKSDGSFGETEKQMIYEYCDELGFDRNIPCCTTELDILLRDLCTISTESEKKIILLELYGLVYADQIFEKEEKNIIDRYVKFSNINAEDEETIRRLYDEYTYLYEKMITKLQID